jgi:hypothetical protein
MDAYSRGVDQVFSVLVSFRNIDNLMNLKEIAGISRMFWTYLKGQALLYFEHQLRRRLEAEDLEHSYDDLIELVLREV